MFESFNALINEPMSRHTTLRLGGPADYLVFPRSSEEIRAMFAEAGAYSVPVTVIGHGSNLLVLDGGIRGLVIRIEKNMRAVRRDGNLLIAQAGAMLGSVAAAAAEAGLEYFGQLCGEEARDLVAANAEQDFEALPPYAGL